MGRDRLEKVMNQKNHSTAPLPCEKFLPEIYDYIIAEIENESDPERFSALQAHIESCTSCSDYYAIWYDTIRLSRQNSLDPVIQPKTKLVTLSTLARIKRQHRKPPNFLRKGTTKLLRTVEKFIIALRKILESRVAKNAKNLAIQMATAYIVIAIMAWGIAPDTINKAYWLYSINVELRVLLPVDAQWSNAEHPSQIQQGEANLENRRGNARIQTTNLQINASAAALQRDKRTVSQLYYAEPNCKQDAMTQNLDIKHNTMPNSTPSHPHDAQYVRTSKKACLRHTAAQTAEAKHRISSWPKVMAN